jgi:hypothetical protein
MNPQNPSPPPQEPLERKYANYFQIGRNAFEVILEFGQFNEQDVKPLLHTSVITTPVHAKKLLLLLEKCVQEHEEAFGVIPDE